jgi:hypothetical protein
MGNVAELLRSVLQLLDLLAQLCLFGLLLAEYFMNVSHRAALLMAL